MLALRVRFTFYTSMLLDDRGVKNGHNLRMQCMNLPAQPPADCAQMSADLRMCAESKASCYGQTANCHRHRGVPTAPTPRNLRCKPCPL